MNERGGVPARVPAIEPNRGDAIGQRMRSRLSRKGFHDADSIGLAGGFPMSEQGADLCQKLRRYHLVRIKVQKPLVAALIFGKALLEPITGPGIVNDAGAKLLGNALRPVGRA